MAIADSHDGGVGAKSSPHHDSDLNLSIRRRPSAGTARAVPDSSPTADSSGAKSSVVGSPSDGSPAGLRSDDDRTEPAKDSGERIRSGENGGVDATLKFAHRPSVPAHSRIRESPLSSNAIFKQSHAGLFNLCIVVLVAVNSRLIIENLMKYGLLIGSDFWFNSNSLRDWPLLMCCLSLPIFPLAAFIVEKLAQEKYIAETVVVFLHLIITTTAVLCPVFVILRCDSAVLSGVTLMLFACIVWLKLVSYAHTSYDMRALAKSAHKEEDFSGSENIEHPYSVSFRNLAYFMVAPTLCYQPSYPRTACIRKGWVIRQLVKLVMFTGLMGFIIEQYINPIVQNSQHPLKGNLLYALERVLKLSVPTLYVWLCMFYCFFHLWLNILAELLRFGDREFYKDWWNARTVDEYWRMWNMPVHKWMLRHIYFPCLRNGIPKVVAILIAFIVSAIFHELCIAVPCHMFKLWAFIGIMFQIPLVFVTNYLRNKFRSSMVGNMIFWLFFSILGQPMCVLLYYHDLINQQGRTESTSSR
ncbi:diacylglycerol O-acyltransferase 1A [Malania oleifera]|uniref:diacylglycerol O-acyltransferase 1A n=1 Tax=Malania oleifera TaxID=397392 RepID=UPI0025AE2CE3|nr:diacylglycerol O-acyltransferase 1A [Malania oleifera]